MLTLLMEPAPGETTCEALNTDHGTTADAIDCVGTHVQYLGAAVLGVVVVAVLIVIGVRYLVRSGRFA